ncbi:MAG: RNA polymerase sigma factor [Patescibacteria group bacterium]
MSQCQKERREQFTEEYEGLFAYLSKYVSFRVPHKEAAEEVIGEVFLYGYAHLDHFDAQRGTMRQWFTGIAKHKIGDHWRKLRPTAELDDALNICNDIDHESWNDTLDASAKAEEILTQLTPEMRALFTLRYIDGMTYEEIATLVRKKPSAIRTHFSRALTRLRQTHSL